MRIGITPFLQPGPSFQPDIEIEQQNKLLGGIGRVGLEDTPDHKIPGKIIPVVPDHLSDTVTDSAEERFGKGFRNSHPLLIHKKLAPVAFSERTIEKIEKIAIDILGDGLQL